MLSQGIFSSLYFESNDWWGSLKDSLEQLFTRSLCDQEDIYSEAMPFDIWIWILNFKVVSTLYESYKCKWYLQSRFLSFPITIARSMLQANIFSFFALIHWVPITKPSNGNIFPFFREQRVNMMIAHDSLQYRRSLWSLSGLIVALSKVCCTSIVIDDVAKTVAKVFIFRDLGGNNGKRRYSKG